MDRPRPPPLNRQIVSPNTCAANRAQSSPCLPPFAVVLPRTMSTQVATSVTPNQLNQPSIVVSEQLDHVAGVRHVRTQVKHKQSCSTHACLLTRQSVEKVTRTESAVIDRQSSGQVALPRVQLAMRTSPPSVRSVTDEPSSHNDAARTALFEWNPTIEQLSEGHARLMINLSTESILKEREAQHRNEKQVYQFQIKRLNSERDNMTKLNHELEQKCGQHSLEVARLVRELDTTQLRLASCESQLEKQKAHHSASTLMTTDLHFYRWRPHRASTN